MGYNLYLGEMTKDEVNALKTMPIKDIINKYTNDNTLPSPYEIVHEKLLDLGSYVDYEDTLVSNYNYGTRIIKSEDTQEGDYYDTGYELCEISKEGLKFIINYYMKKASNYYSQLLNSLTIIGSDTNQLTSFLKRRKVDWLPDEKVLGALDFSDSPYLARSWDYEYNAFNLLLIYKSFDWQNKSLILYGY